MSKSQNLNSEFLPSAREMADYDNYTISSGISAINLMRKAGQAMADSILSRIKKNKDWRSSRICILCGPGNNGGDGLVVATILRKRLKNVVVVTASSKRYSNEHLLVAKEFIKSAGKIYANSAKDRAPYLNQSAVLKGKALKELVVGADIIIDALLGTGQSEEPRASIAELVNLAKANRTAKVFSLDVPTGLNADSGEVYHSCVRADRTICVELIKRGMLQWPARDFCGKIEIVPIGIKAFKPAEFFLLNKHTVPRLAKRKSSAHKGDFGHVLVIGGCHDMPGAPILSATAALRSGAALVTLARLPAFQASQIRPEIMLKNIDSSKRFFSEEALPAITRDIDKFSTLVVGPGLGQHPATAKFFSKLISTIIRNNIAAVIDADGLNILAELVKQKNSLKLPSCILTPHPGEAARLLGTSSAEVQRDRYSAARELSLKFGCVVILKGAGTIVYSLKSGVVNVSGNPYMASAGSGDVLSGVIAAMFAQGLNQFDAAQLGVFAHGLSADIALEEINAPLIAGDLISSIASALADLQC